MPKAASETKTKAATKAANSRTAKAPKEEKEKRPPTAYNIFMKDELAKWKANNPGASHKDAFAAVANLWKDAPENPKRGQPTEKRSKKAKGADGKENDASKPKSKSKSKTKAKKEEAVEQSDEEMDPESDE